MKLIRTAPLAILLVWVAPLLGDEETYTNPTLDFSITKPDSWHFATAEEMAENLKRVEMDDEQFKAMMVKHATAPIVALTKYKEPYDDLNPSIKVNIKPLLSFSPDEPVKILELVTKPLSKLFRDFETVTAPKETKLAGLKAAYTAFDYTLAVPDGRTFPTRSELWIVPRGKMFFMIGAGTRQDEMTGTRKEVRAIIKGIELGEKSDAKSASVDTEREQDAQSR